MELKVKTIKNEGRSSNLQNIEYWKILVVDDNHTVHDVTNVILEDEIFENKPLKILNAYSTTEAKEILEKDKDIAVILLDISMEGAQSGLKLAKIIRDELQNQKIRIIIRTGLPDISPEASVAKQYDIHDYKDKSSLTAQALKTSVLSGVRAYRDIINEACKYQLQSDILNLISALVKKEIDIEECLTQILIKTSQLFQSYISYVFIADDNLIWYNNTTENNNTTNDYSDIIAKNSKFELIENTVSTTEQEGTLIVNIPILCYNSVIAVIKLFCHNKSSHFSQHYAFAKSALEQIGIVAERIQREQKIKQQYLNLLSSFQPLEQLKHIQDDIIEYKKIDTNDNLESVFDQMLATIDKLNKKLSCSQLRLESIIESMPAILIGIDKDYKITEWNSRAEQLTGIKHSDALGEGVKIIIPNITDILPLISSSINEHHPIVRHKLVNLFKNNMNNKKNEETKYYDILIYPIEVNGSYTGAVIKIDDITEDIEFQELITKNDKLISIGGIVSGVAHELNNPLSSIMQNAQNVIRRFDQKIKANIEQAEKLNLDLSTVNTYITKRNILEFINNILDATKRAHHISGNLLSFSRQSDFTKTSSEFPKIIDRALFLASNDDSILKTVDLSSIQIIKDYESDLPEIYCIEIEIEQVLLNLIKNATYAMYKHPSRKEHKLIFTLYKKEPFIYLEVQDTGCGIELDIQDKIFKPFFTTKPQGEGTGLGLSVCRGIIIESHEGKFEVKSDLHEGTTFIIALPIKTKHHPEIKHH